MSMKIFVAGHQGMVGKAICRRLKEQENVELIVKTREELDLLNQENVFSFLKSETPEYVILAAAKVGGIAANTQFPAQFIYENIQIQNNVIHGAHLANVQSLLFLGSSCIYPRLADQPLSEKALLSGKFEPTNEPYAIAKVAGIKMCESYNRQYGRDYRSVMPTNLYGPGDNFHPENSHVLPALIKKFHEAHTNGDPFVLVWGSGKPRREFLYVDDMASACLFVMGLPLDQVSQHLSTTESHINIGTGKDISIMELAELVKKVVGYTGELKFDKHRPDGPPRKVLDVTLLNKLGWRATTDLESGIKKVYAWFAENQGAVRMI